MDKKKISIEVEKFSILADEESNSQLAIVEIYVCHDGNNLHNVPISNEALVNAKDTLKNKFLVAGYDGVDFEGHEDDEQIIGFFPESSKMRFEKIGDRTYLVAQAIMSKIYAKWAYNIFVDDNKRAVSMEITVLKGQVDQLDNLVTIDEFVFNGVTVLGLSHVPACEGSSASIIKFDKENALKVYNMQYEKATDLKKKYIDDMVKFSGKEEAKKMKEENMTEVVEQKCEDKVTETECNNEMVEEKPAVDCAIPEDDANSTLYDKNVEDDSAKDSDEEKMEESNDSIPTENCEAKENTSEGEEKPKEEDYELVLSERDSLKKENEELKTKVANYESLEKKSEVEKIISSVINVFSTDEIDSLREDAEKYSLNELSIFDNEVKAKAFDLVKKDAKSNKSYNKVAINDILGKGNSKYTW